jgi:hypothetical protein
VLKTTINRNEAKIYIVHFLHSQIFSFLTTRICSIPFFTLPRIEEYYYLNSGATDYIMSCLKQLCPRPTIVFAFKDLFLLVFSGGIDLEVCRIGARGNCPIEKRRPTVGLSFAPHSNAFLC